MEFQIGAYVRYINKVWTIDAIFDDMMFLRNVDDDSLELVLPWEYHMVKEY